MTSRYHLTVSKDRSLFEEIFYAVGYNFFDDNNNNNCEFVNLFGESIGK